MVVVDGARKMINKTVDIGVTSVHQTTAGKMIFGRYDERGEQTPRTMAAAPAEVPPGGRAPDSTTPGGDRPPGHCIRNRGARSGPNGAPLSRSRCLDCVRLLAFQCHELLRSFPPRTRYPHGCRPAETISRTRRSAADHFHPPPAGCVPCDHGLFISTRAEDLVSLEDKVAKAALGRPARVVHGGDTRQAVGLKRPGAAGSVDRNRAGPRCRPPVCHPRADRAGHCRGPAPAAPPSWAFRQLTRLRK